MGSLHKKLGRPHIDPIEEKYYAVTLLLQEVCDGHDEHAHQYMRDLLELTRPEQGTLHERRILAWELNVLLCNRAHQHKVSALNCEQTRRAIGARIEACSDAAQLEELLLQVVDQYILLVRQHSRLKNSNLIRDCLEHIDAYYTEPLTLTGEAKRLNVTASYLSARFAKETGKTFVNYLTDVRLQHACEYLEHLQRPIQQIAEWSGFSSSNYFTRVFRLRIGMSPTQYRRINQSR